MGSDTTTTAEVRLDHGKAGGSGISDGRSDGLAENRAGRNRISLRRTLQGRKIRSNGMGIRGISAQRSRLVQVVVTMAATKPRTIGVMEDHRPTKAKLAHNHGGKSILRASFDPFRAQNNFETTSPTMLTLMAAREVSIWVSLSLRPRNLHERLSRTV
jgi:hypothetical protein